jgi:hypothetical protein
MMLSLLGWTATAVRAEIRGASAKEIEAAFLVQFSKYVIWPDSVFSGSDAPIILGILGRDPFGSALDQIALK